MKEAPSSHASSHTRPMSGAAPFEAGEVFFSRTDTRGVIQAGNSVFRRVADYDWQELIGAPHKIIRHPDMPKGVFHILWDRIQKGQPVGAYVKNRAKDGLHYWVFATVTPCPDGYLSARIKPTSARLAAVEDLYADLRRQETEEGLSPPDCAAKIEAAAQELGFSGYDDFAADSLSEELLSEQAVLGAPPPKRIVAARGLLEHIQKLETEAGSLLAAFDALTAVPRNLQIKAKRLEPTGGPLTALSSDYGRMSQEMSTWFSENVIGANDNFGKIAHGIKKTLLFNSTREVLARCYNEIILDTDVDDGICVAAEQDLLSHLIDGYSHQAAAEMQKLELETIRLSKACKEMHRALLGLNTVRVTGKIENARLVGDTSSLGEIISHLGRSQEHVERHLDAAKEAVDMICDGVKNAQRLERHINREVWPERRRARATA